MTAISSCVPESIELVLFDNDGVLVDSEKLSFEIYAEEISLHGPHTDPVTLMEETSGLPHELIIAHSLPNMSAEEQKKIGDHIQAKIRQAFLNRPLQANRGVIDLLTYLQAKNIPFCVATNGTKERLDTAFFASGLDRFFPEDKRFTAYMVEKGKPAPDLYLFAARNCGVEIEHCLVIEDSVTGIRAAHAAHMAVIGYLGASHAQHTWYREWIMGAQPSCRADSMHQIISLID
jgi:HAD superfamily hydrolase (TIGR01509 family)